MMNEELINSLPNAYNLEDDKAVWDEYRYRHELIWSLIFKITTAVIAVSVLPYIADEKITTTLKYWIIWLPLIGLCLLLLGYLRLKREVEILNGLKELHRRFHRNKYGISYEKNEDGWIGKYLKKKDWLQKYVDKVEWFWAHLKLYLIAIGILGLINICLLIFLWIPNAQKDDPSKEQQIKTLLLRELGISDSAKAKTFIINVY